MHVTWFGMGMVVVLCLGYVGIVVAKTEMCIAKLGLFVLSEECDLSSWK
jgi:hypothetical protein